jgi:hypothetical protein
MKQAAWLHGVMSQKTKFSITTSIRTSNPTKIKYFMVKNTLQGV